MRVAVIGRTGQLATSLAAAPRPGWTVRAFGRDEIELSARLDPAPALDPFAPDLVILAAAHTSVDRAERERERAFAVNAVAPGAIARWCAARGAALIHISTDYVFSGSGSAPLTEADTPAPVNVYGESKRAGEVQVLDSGARALVLRTAWLHSPRRGNFVTTMLRLTIGTDCVPVVADQRGSPSSAEDLADAIAALAPLLRNGAVSGLYHCAGAGEVDRAGFARAIFEGAQARGLVGHVPKVVPIATADYPTAARRPLDTRLDCGRLLREAGVQLPGWRVGLERTLNGLARTATEKGAAP